MLVFIDESGDSGRKFNAGSSTYFTCVAAIFSDSFNADACDRSIDELRRKLKLPLRYEFHFTNCSDRVRREFLKRMAVERFRYYGFVLNKSKLFGAQFENTEGFYDFTVGLICDNARELLNNAKVVIDKCGDREFLRRLERSLKSRMLESDGNQTTSFSWRICFVAQSQEAIHPVQRQEGHTGHWYANGKHAYSSGQNKNPETYPF